MDGIDPVHITRIQDQTQRAVVQESHRYDPGQKGREKVLAREQRVVEWDKSHMEELKEAVEKINRAAETFDVGLRFRIHEETERIMVQVIDRETNEIIREIPPEKILNLVAQIQNLIGIFIDTRR